MLARHVSSSLALDELLGEQHAPPLDQPLPGSHPHQSKCPSEQAAPSGTPSDPAAHASASRLLVDPVSRQHW